MPKPAEVISRWHYSLENFNTSTLEYLQSMEGTLAQKDAPVRPKRVDYHESGVLRLTRFDGHREIVYSSELNTRTGSLDVATSGIPSVDNCGPRARPLIDMTRNMPANVHDAHPAVTTSDPNAYSQCPSTTQTVFSG